MGGQYQPVGQTHVLQNIFDFNMNIQESIDFPRAFNLEGKYTFEKSIPKTILIELEKLGHMNSYDCSNKNKIPDMVNKIVKEDDIIIVMGAGDIYQSIELIYSKIHA